MKALNWIDRQNPLAGIAVILLCFVIAGLIAAAGRPPAQPQPQVRPAYVLVFATAQPTAPLPTADTRELEALRAKVAELESAQRPQAAEPVYKAMAQDVATATPEMAPLITQPAWTADPQIVHSETGTTSVIEVPASAPRLCTGFGDWRDYDARFAASKVCNARP